MSTSDFLHRGKERKFFNRWRKEEIGEKASGIWQPISTWNEQ